MQRYQQIHISDITGRWGVFDNSENLGIIATIYEQELASNQWTIKHDMNSDKFLIKIFRKNENNSRELIESVSKIQIDSPNILTILLSEPISGFAELVFFN